MEHPNARLETFCDGVFAIALTLLIIDIKIPSTIEINSAKDFWKALYAISPSILAFILSFVVIFITWVNHHNALRLISKSSPAFIYANGFLLFTVVFIPFPTSLLGEHLFTVHAAPAVILYDAVLALQALSWVLFINAALKHHLGKHDKAVNTAIRNRRFGFFALALYSVCAVMAIWFPMPVAIITLLSWIIWLIVGIIMQPE
ncbi:MAG: DUF1211 domain-containing protein [Chitinophagales bacterium]|nr:DUF1211 domain-containing protein [Chitinophagales bacterium]